MLMLYNSDHFAVVQIEIAAEGEIAPAEGVPALTRGGYEIVDKHARKELFLEGAMAEQFKLGVEKLIETEPSEDDIDAFLARFTTLATQPVVLH
ncbi:BTH_I0359 family protein [Caldimonas sp. KR1-144]|uniref:BTH_I0359 family protein n=1 Tax=Caldimonas sp. KR1-144 TaxID=3400911 RepID=UPI003C0C4179